MRVRDAQPQDAHAIAEIHVAVWRTTYRGVVPDNYLAGLSVDYRARRWATTLAGDLGRTCAFVAEDDAGHVVGFADGGPVREGDPAYAGELYAIYILKEYQGQSIGRRLVAAVAERLYALGMPSMLIWALTANPACRFYETLGGRLVERKPTEIGGATLDESAYGWLDTRSLYTPAEQQ